MPWRNLIRWAALVCSIAIVFWLGPSAIRSYRDWREAAVNDPSAAELYETEFWFEAAGIAAPLGIGSVFFFVLRHKKEPCRGTSGGSIQK